MARRPKDANTLVPKAAAGRLSRYLRYLEELGRTGAATTSSQQLGKALGVTAAQVRKDLGYFGQFGFPGLGYKISHLVPAIRKILGTDKLWNVAVVGIGNLGTALLRYRGFAAHGFQITTLFDVEPDLVGRQIAGLEVFSIDSAADLVPARGIELAILSVPAAAAQDVADDLVAAGIRGIYNFAPCRLSLPAGIGYVSIDLAVELEQLSFVISQADSQNSTGESCTGDAQR